MPNVQVCPYCQYANTTNARFCIACGKALLANDLVGTSSSSLSPTLDKATVSVNQTTGEIKDGGVSAGVVYGSPGSVQFFGGQYNFGKIPEEKYKPPPLPQAGSIPEPGVLPPGSRLTFPRNVVFTGRESVLRELAKRLFYDRDGPLTKPQALVGLGGVGKTQLAVELCYRYGRFTYGVHWISDAKTQDQFESEIAKCGLKMGLSGWNQNQQEQVASTLREWQHQPYRLVVLDNIEDPSTLEKSLSELIGLCILITTRRRTWPVYLGIDRHTIDMLSRSESLDLLYGLAPRLRETSTDDLNLLAEGLFDLPLALHMAGSLLERVISLTPKEYLVELKKAGGALNYQPLPESMRYSPTKHDMSIFSTFQISWNQLDKKLDALTRFLFCASGYARPNVEIPKDVLIRTAINGIQEWQRHHSSDVDLVSDSDKSIPTKTEIDIALSQLFDLGLIEIGAVGPRLHPLLSEFARALDNAESRPAKSAYLSAQLSVTSVDGLPRPEVGFFGRDETLLALDRAFDRQKIVLLLSHAGSGKTMTAAEFARWYLQTGGLEGPVLFTAFTEYKPLNRVLDTLEETFRPLLEENNIDWLALSDEQRLNLTTQIFKQLPVLWIWDNVDPVSGFPAGAPSAWTKAEQKELKYFLDNMAAMTKAKFLLTSRRDEDDWLGELPARVKLPPMPMQEIVQLACALAEKRGARLENVEDWRPLLAFTQGNPLALTAVVGQALRDGLKTRAQVGAYVERLRAGEAAFTDDEKEGRSKSLGASLKYGFEQAFSDDERKALALLHFFQGFVHVESLLWMGRRENEFALPELENLTPDVATRLLDRAAEIGLLEAHGGGYYSIHPALPWFFNGYYAQYYGQREAKAERAFVQALGALGDYYHDQYQDGKREVIGRLRPEEANLLHARRLALHQARRASEIEGPERGWWSEVTSTMQGLYTLYDHTGRRAEWRRLVEQIVPDFVGLNDLPLSGREEQWNLVTQYRVRLAREERRWDEAEKLQQARVEWNNRRVAALDNLPEKLRIAEKSTIRSLAVSMHELGEIQRELGSPECVKSFEEAANLMRRISDRTTEAAIDFNLSLVYTKIPALRNLDAAEVWCRRSLELIEEADRMGRAKCLCQLGNIAWERFHNARMTNDSEARLLEYENSAIWSYQQALELLPPDAADDLGVVHNQLGILYADSRNVEQAFPRFNDAATYFEASGNYYSVGVVRRNVAEILSNVGRFDDALLYARAALRNFEPYGQGAAEEIQNTQRLLAQIEERMRGGG